MDTAQYHRKMLPHTSDNPSNLIISTDPTKEYKESLIKTLLHIKPHLPFYIYRQLYPTREVTPHMQG